jgi:ketosteroid isomerase-like protein
MGKDREDLQEVRRAIEARSRDFEKHYAAADAAALVQNYFVPDAMGPMACPPGGHAPVRGRGALTQMFGGMFAGMPKIRLEPIEVLASGELAYELGRAHLRSAAGDAVMGRYTVAWQKCADGWRARVDFFAADGWSD